jgi:hypothetical protein
MLSRRNKQQIPVCLNAEYELISKRGKRKDSKRGILENWIYRRGHRHMAVFRFGAHRECFSVADFVTDWEIRRWD